jgi:large subunit ribosomal protein L1
MKKVDHKTSKRFLEAKKQIDAEKVYSVEEAIALIKETSTTKFDASVEIHVNLGVDIKKSDQQVRSSVSLPHGTGKNVIVAVMTPDSDKQKAAKEAGADIIGEKDLIEEIKKGKINFDVIVATPDAMKELAPAAKVLGPRGLMPNPKDGTVTQNVAEIVSKLKKGQVNYKNDDSGNLHSIIGKASFGADQLKENYDTLIESIKKAKPQTSKGVYIRNISLSSAMGPGIKVLI